MRVRSVEVSEYVDVWTSVFRPSVLLHNCHCYQNLQTINQPSPLHLLLQPLWKILRWRINIKYLGTGNAPWYISVPRTLCFFPNSLKQVTSYFTFIRLMALYPVKEDNFRVCFLQFIWKWKVEFGGLESPILLNHMVIQILLSINVKLAPSDKWPASLD